MMLKRKIVFQVKGKKCSLTLFSKLSLLLLGICFSLLIAELIIRTHISFPLAKEYMRFCSLNYILIPRKMLDKDLLWDPSVDLAVMRYSMNKKNDIFRIVCIGDSNTEGYRTLGKEETYPYILEKIFKKKFSNKKIEVINAGRSGYSSYQGLAYLKKDLSKYNPDLVISWFGIQDSMNAWFFEDKEQKIPSAAVSKKNILEYSKLYLIVKNFPLIWKALNSKIPRVCDEDFLKNCREMASFSQKLNCKVIFIIPFRRDLKKDKILYLANCRNALLSMDNEYNCMIVDVVPFLSKYNPKDLFFDGCHPNYRGNVLIAKAIYTLLEDEWSDMMS